MTVEGSSMENNDRQYRETFDSTIRETLSQAVRIIAADPALVIPGTVILRHQRKAAAVRTRHEREGLLVPPVMIVSVTSRCNLVCTGCYMHERGERPDAEMSPEVLASVVEQAAGLGVSVIVLAGGEPLIRHEEIIRLARAHPRVLFPVFTNGLLIDDRVADTIAGCRNIVPVVSFEGFREETDGRRGSGVYRPSPLCLYPPERPGRLLRVLDDHDTGQSPSCHRGSVRTAEGRGRCPGDDIRRVRADDARHGGSRPDP